MNSDSYKIIISLSHHRIAFEYWLRDGENKLVPMPNMTWPAPLAFYCSPNGIEIGETAMRAVHSGTSNAFDNYFDRLTNDETYLYGGQRKPLRYLLLDATETIFEDFFKKVMLGNKGSLSDNRATMPITLVCESDIKPNERVLLLDLFKSSGYNRFKIVEYNTFIESYLRATIAKEYACDNALVAWTEGTDLTFTLFNLRNESERNYAYHPGLGVDPRLDYVKKLIWERIKGQNPWLNFLFEEETISKAASDFLTSSTPLVNDTLILSDGLSYHYSLNRRVIDNLQCNEGEAIRSKLEGFLRENNLTISNKTLLLLRGIAAGNKFFEQTIGQGFTNTIRSDKKLRNSTMQLLIHDSNPVVAQELINVINESPQPREEDETTETYSGGGKDDRRLKELKRRWREVNAQSSGMQREGRANNAIQLLKKFKEDCMAIDEAKDLTIEIESKIASLQRTDASTKPESTDTATIKSIEREWRVLRATAKGKVRNGQTAEAIQLLKAFIKKISPTRGTEKVLEDATKELSVLDTTKTDIPSGRKQDEGKTTKKSARLESNATSTSEGNKLSDNEGEKLIASGKLKEARDWYRTSGNSSKAKTLSDLIRSQKGVELRKISLEECRKIKNRDQIKRIILELQNYISQCNEVKYECTEFKRLLSEYKKLI